MIRRRRPAGFSLLEVMIALAILAAALLTASQITAASLRNHRRAIQLEVATLLARGKLAELQDGYEQTGFKGFDEEEEGSFEDEGHPEVHWKAHVARPRIDLSPDKLLATLTGGGASGVGDLGKLLGLQGQAQGGSSNQPAGMETLFPGAGAMAAGLQAQLATIGEELKSGVRELRLTISWQDGKQEESFTVVTHLVVLAPPGAAPIVNLGAQQAGQQQGGDQPATGQPGGKTQ
ncbi:MAG: prepilin-type N-terminal cleavage/methylation domain-containing protein [Anaeromyxobacter sp.]